MKLKGISVFEQHAEKAVFAVAALFAVAIFVLQFVGSPNAVEIGGVSAPPDRAVEEVRQAASAVQGQIEGDSSSVEVPEAPRIAEFVSGAMDSDLIPPGERVVALVPQPEGAGSTFAFPGGASDPVPEWDPSSRFVEVTAPTPRDAVAHAFAGAIDPYEPMAIPELASMLPPEQPHDVRAVSVQATFDAPAFRRALASIPQDETLNPLPAAWWQNTVELLDVELVRERLLDDGSWGERTTVGPIPGRESLRDRITDASFAPRDQPQLIADERAFREDVRRPAFYNLVAGERWIWPALAAEIAEDDPDAEQVAALVRERAGLRAQIEQIRRRQDAGSGRDRRGNDDDRRDRRGDRGAGGSGSEHASGWGHIPNGWFAQIGAPGGGGGRERETNDREREQRGREAAEARIAELEVRIAEIEDALADLGRGPEGQRLDDPLDRPFDEPLTSLTDPTLEDGVTVWAHDLGVRPGETYRYAVRVWVTNPFFGHALQIGEEQAALAEDPAIATALSDWTDAVDVLPERVYVVSAARDAGGLGGFATNASPTAFVEVFQFYYGYWRSGDVQLEPGDRLRAELDLPEGLPIFTFDDGTSGGPGGLPGLGEPEAGPESIEVVEDVVLLDVVRAGDDELYVYFSTPDGRVEVRNAGRADASDAAAYVRASAAEGAVAEVAEPGSGDRRRGSRSGGFSGPTDDGGGRDGGQGIGGGGGGGGGFTPPPP